MTATKHAIPTIDFAPFLAGGEAGRRSVAAAVGAAAETYGFMTLVGHGIPKATVDATFAAAVDFFDLPDAAKLAVQEKQTNRGFQPLFDNISKEGKKSGAEAFSMGHPVPPSDPSLLALPFYAATPWPDRPGFRDGLVACYLAMFGLAERVLEAMALHLGAAPDFFAKVSRNTYSNMRVIHYPPRERIATVTDIGVQAHEDQGLVTLLIQDMNGGLSVRGPEEEWLPVVPNPDAVVVNVAKLMTRWTNGRFKSAMHRVTNTSGRERYSIPLFVHPDYRQVIDARDLAAPGEEIRFEPIVAGETVYANFARQRVSWGATVPPSAPGSAPAPVQQA
ncbi:MAG: isopenicillin N synthase family dioxygenase [Alphaproteobacteria bacterium]